MSVVSRVFLSGEPEPDEPFSLPPEAAGHLTRVLRARPGDRFEAVTPDGRVLLAELLPSGEAVVVSVLEEPDEAPERRVVLYQAVPKGKRMEVAVEKAVEVGVDAVVPVLSERSVARPGEGTKLERWRRIAESAARQALRRVVPEVRAPVPYTEAVREAGPSGVILHNDPGLPVLERALGGEGDVALLIGPEGGFTEGELAFAREVGVRAARLGPYRLRSETAGLVAVVRARTVVELAAERAGCPE
ncbi:TIGR00046: RNA methyltransferase, RsmE family [Rubrobacter radiotolerans]|uniref:Ribosomal RNA small subunit methyltransferase E n=1 Tax=Rubrobacter radiotolerans TaxID=42256 RepID=A0A023X386_RUBRA|nr:RsmE family RNA methyltransferase [Rubrobacter radiotolerans]AHY46803.1 TIGR00046: RNA methyltransferase, RsmE family [Rubrobacter radiotolerans]MDX5894210.1 RsmE family RNA methyltransferase [Rubrobacter radiotolerans]SMC05477.1 16S rRNA (uracil1498-N3)-methyltransferase [Rubrobacter radiotolerans DSM 5868]